MPGQTRDPRYTRVVGDPPFVGRRYVSGGKVRVSWTENGKRRRRTVGPNTAANRTRADEMLQDTLRGLRNATYQSEPAAEAAAPCTDVADAVRSLVLAALDLADTIADRVGAAIGRGRG